MKCCFIVEDLMNATANTQELCYHAINTESLVSDGRPYMSMDWEQEPDGLQETRESSGKEYGNPIWECLDGVGEMAGAFIPNIDLKAMGSDVAELGSAVGAVAEAAAEGVLGVVGEILSGL